jgi:hypothetical protein
MPGQPEQDGLNLPVVNQAPSLDETEPIVVTVFRDSGAPVATDSRNDADLDAWRIRVGMRTVGWSREELTQLGDQLRGLAETKLERPGNPYSASTRVLLMRVPADAPVDVVFATLEQASNARIWNVFYAVAARKDQDRGAISCPLPRDRGGQTEIVLHLRVSWDAGLGVLRRVLGPTTSFELPRMPPISTEEIAIAAGDAGTDQLATLLRTKYIELEAKRSREGYLSLDLTLEPDSRVAWQHVIDLIQLAQASGNWRIGFWSPQLSRPPASGRMR